MMSLLRHRPRALTIRPRATAAPSATNRTPAPINHFCWLRCARFASLVTSRSESSLRTKSSTHRRQTTTAAPHATDLTRPTTPICYSHRWRRPVSAATMGSLPSSPTNISGPTPSRSIVGSATIPMPRPWRGCCCPRCTCRLPMGIAPAATKSGRKARGVPSERVAEELGHASSGCNRSSLWRVDGLGPALART